MLHFNIYNNSSVVDTYIQGGYTNLLLGVDRAATSQPAVQKLNFGHHEETRDDARLSRDRRPRRRHPTQRRIPPPPPPPSDDARRTAIREAT